MGQVVSFTDFTPSPRYDNVPFEEVRIEEAPYETGPWTEIDTVSIGTPDPDPADPAARSFSTSNGTAAELWYRVIFIDGNGGESQATLPLQNIEVATVASTPYSTTDELARILKIREPTAEQVVALQRVLEAAAMEINSELGRTEPFDDPAPSLVVEVNLERAVEHWQQGSTPFGIVGLGDAGATYTARDTWDRHAHKLAPLKASWGVA